MALTLKDILADIKANKKRAFLNLLLTLLVLGLLACTLYVSIALIPFITGTMALILLALATETLIMFILRVYLALLNYNQNNYLSFLSLFYIIPTLLLIVPSQQQPEAQILLLVSLLTLLLENGLSKVQKASLLYITLARLAALGLGIYLAVQIVPFAISAVAATGITYGMALVFGLVAAATVIYLTDLLLNLPLHLHKAYFQLTISWELFFKHIESLFWAGLAIYFSSLVFPLASNILLLILPYGLASFTALAVSVGVFFLTVHSIGLIWQGLIVGFKGLWNLMFESDKALDSSSVKLTQNPDEIRHAAEPSAQLLQARASWIQSNPESSDSSDLDQEKELDPTEIYVV